MNKVYKLVKKGGGIMSVETQEILIQIANISEKIDQKFLEQDKRKE